jgi:uncharacterized protein YqgC (DUF456 family)
MELPTKQKSQMTKFSGLILVCVGIICTYDSLFYPAPILGTQLRWLGLFGPTFLLVGCVISLRGFAFGRSSVFRYAVLILGLLMLVIGGCPWLYTPYLIGGGRDNEGAGMLGMIIFIFVGLPGLVVSLVALRMKSNNYKDGPPNA